MLEFDYQEKQTVWNRIIKDHPECEAHLRAIAETIKEAKVEKVPLPEGTSRDDVVPAIELGILVLDSEGVEFADTISFLYFLARSIVENTLLGCWDELEDFWGKIKTLQFNNSNFGPLRYQASMSLVVLSNDYNENVFEKINKVFSLEIEKNMWSIILPFCDALPNLQVKADDLAAVLEGIYQYIRGDFAAGTVFNSVENFCNKQVSTGMGLLNKLIEIPDSDATWFIPSAIVGIAKKNGIKAIFEETHALMGRDHVQLVAMGINASSLFNYDNKTHDLLVKTLEKYKNLLAAESRPVILANLTKAYGNLLEMDKSITQVIIELSSLAVPDVQYEIAGILLKKHDLSSSENWYLSALMNLSAVDIQYKAITDFLDMVLYEVVLDSPDKVFQFLESWIENHPKPEKETSIIDLFDDLFNQVLEKHKDRFEYYLTKWLNADDLKFHLHIQEILSEYEVRRTNLILDKSVLGQLSVKDVKYVLMKILGFVLDNRNLCNLAFSVLQRTPEDENLNLLISTVFKEYIAYNYPGRAGKLLTEKVQTGTRVEQKVATEVVEYLVKYHKDRSDLQQLKEFLPPERRAAKFEKMKAKKWGQQIHEASREESDIMQLVRTVTLKGGQSSFSKVNGEYTPKSYLSEHSVSMEFPRGEFLDPTGQSIDRMGWRLCKRGDM